MATSGQSVAKTSKPLTSSRADSRANQFHLLAEERRKQTQGGSGPSLPKLLGHFDLRTFSWKTSPDYVLPTKERRSGRSCPIWPDTGTMRSGRVYQQPHLVPHTFVTGSFLWPTPHANAGTGAGTSGRRGSLNLQTAVLLWPTPNSRDHRSGWGTKPRDGHALNLVEAVNNRYSDRSYPKSDTTRSGLLNPTWVELLMGFPVGWTDIVD
jgi:hypothetical protein